MIDWLQPAQAVVLLIVGGGITYLTQRRLESIKAERQSLTDARARLHAAELRLRDERRHVYLTVLDPYVRVLHALNSGLPASEANERLVSADHRKAAFELKFVGTDEVVRAFNTFARHIVDVRAGAPDPPGALMRHWAVLLHAIRRSVGDPETTISPREMIYDWVTDIENVFPEEPESSRLVKSREAR